MLQPYTDDSSMSLPLTLINITTTEPPNSTDGGQGGNTVDPGGLDELNLVLWLTVGGSLLCLVSALLSYVFLVWLPRRG